jgi:hypothetical protein
MRLAGRFRWIGDTEQQAYDQIAPEQPGKLLGHFGGVTIEESGRSRLVSRCTKLGDLENNEWIVALKWETQHRNCI